MICESHFREQLLLPITDRQEHLLSEMRFTSPGLCCAFVHYAVLRATIVRHCVLSCLLNYHSSRLCVGLSALLPIVLYCVQLCTATLCYILRAMLTVQLCTILCAAMYCCRLYYTVGSFPSRIATSSLQLSIVSLSQLAPLFFFSQLLR